MYSYSSVGSNAYALNNIFNFLIIYSHGSYEIVSTTALITFSPYFCFSSFIASSQNDFILEVLATYDFIDFSI